MKPQLRVNSHQSPQVLIDAGFRKCEEKRPLQGYLLDIGCGDGEVSSFIKLLLADSKVKVEGCDVSEKMVNYAKKNFESNNLTFYVWNLEHDVPINKIGRYDYVLSSFVFHWIPDQLKALKNVYSLLKPGGECLITFLPKAAHFNTYRRMAQLARWAPFMKDVEDVISPYQDTESPETQFQLLMVQCGFHDVEVSCFSRVHDQGTLQSLRDLLRAINPFIARIPEDEREEYMLELLDAYIKCTSPLYQGPPKDDGPVYYSYHFLKARGTK